MPFIEIEEKCPERALRRLRRLGGNAFLLSGNPKGWGGGGFSYASASPASLVVTDPSGRTFVDGVRTDHADPFAAVDSAIARLRVSGPPGVPFAGGAVGYFSYDLKGLVTPTRFRALRRSNPATPLAVVGVYDAIYAFDHDERRAYIITTDDCPAEKLKTFAEALEGQDAVTVDEGPALGHDLSAGLIEEASNFTRDEYIDAVARAQRYISDGEIYQINLSQRLRLPMAGDPLALYEKLSEKSPAPYSSFLDNGPFQVISNSPESLLRAQAGVVETSPIKGTRPRGTTPGEDEALLRELLSSPKERAEHVMIVDLERNDLGRVATPGTVEVVEFEKMMTLPGLHHMVSTVRARLTPGLTPFDCLRAAFPGGSITGAPKIRAMEIIDELETVGRGVYTGAIGWAGPGGTEGAMDMAMAIRTGVASQGCLYLHVGGGIVADSSPEFEYEETLLKAASFLAALRHKGAGEVDDPPVHKAAGRLCRY